MTPLSTDESACTSTPPGLDSLCRFPCLDFFMTSPSNRLGAGDPDRHPRICGARGVLQPKHRRDLAVCRLRRIPLGRCRRERKLRGKPLSPGTKAARQKDDQFSRLERCPNKRMDETQEIIKEFLIESNENLARLDQEFVELEQRPNDQNLLSSIFRTIHTIKGTCGFLGFGILEAITHRAENMLSQLREGQRRLTPGLTTLLLETVDMVKKILAEIETTGAEGSETYDELRNRLQAACDGQDPEEPAVREASLGDRSEDQVDPSEPTRDAAGQTPADEPFQGEQQEPTSQDVGESAEPVTTAAESTAGEAPTEASQLDEAAPPKESVAGARKAPAETRSSVADSTIRVPVGVLDKLMNLVGELVLARNQVLQHTTTQEDAGLTATSQRLNLITTELQANVMKTRMQPIGVVWNKFPRVVRDLGHAAGKQIDLEMEGAETELDKTIIEAIKDPLTHIVRNSCDHGIETPEQRAAKGKQARGRLTMRAYHEGGQVNIEIADDGAGIDPQKLKQKAVQKGLVPVDQAERMSEREMHNLIFLPGLSTTEKVTNVSGRGVGMDVVKTNVEKIGGSIDLQSAVGQGTTIKIKIPLTLAIIPALVASCAGERFAIPQVNLVELVRLEAGATGQQIEWIHGAPVYRLRGKLLPLVYLSKVLELDGAGLDEKDPERTEEPVNIIVLQADDKTFGLVVDGVNDTAEIVVKPLSKLLKGLDCYAGATIMGDGRVALILDVMGLGQLAHVVSQTREQTHVAREHQADLVAERQTVLLFRSGSAERLAVPLALVDRLEEFPHSQIEQSGGRRVTQYRNQILPLIPLAELLSLGDSAAETQDPVQVVVFSEGTRRMGVVVDEIVDIVEETISIRSRTSRQGILGSAVVSGNVMDFIDLHYLIEAADKNWFGGSQDERAEGARVLVAEGSSFSRGLMRNSLEMAGFRVIEAGTTAEVLDKLKQQSVDVMVSSLDLPGDGPSDLLASIRVAPDLCGLPILGLANTAEETHPQPGAEYQFDDCQLKFDRDSMLRSVEKLAAVVTNRQPVEQRG